MQIDTTSLDGVLIITPKRHGDHRGFFSETFKSDVLAEAAGPLEWTQDNHSYSSTKGVVRGLHFQAPPFAQAKLLRVTRGAILDVAVDIRVGSPTYGQHVAVELSQDNWRQLLVPAGYAHGFCTLTDETEVLYKVTSTYAPAAEGGLLWHDPKLGIPWPVTRAEATTSKRDEEWPTLEDLKSPSCWNRSRTAESSRRSGGGQQEAGAGAAHRCVRGLLEVRLDGREAACLPRRFAWASPNRIPHCGPGRSIRTARGSRSAGRGGGVTWCPCPSQAGCCRSSGRTGLRPRTRFRCTACGSRP